MRHLFPSFALLSIGVAYVFARFETRLKMTVLLPGVLTLSALLVLVSPARLIRVPLLARYLVGISDEGPLLDNICPGFHAVLRWVNENTEPDAKIMMCWDAREFRLRRQTVIDPGGRTWSTIFRAAGEDSVRAAQYLRARGVDYLLVNESALRYNVYKSRLIPEEVLTQFKRQHAILAGVVLVPVMERYGVGLYRVAAPRLSPASNSYPARG